MYVYVFWILAAVAIYLMYCKWQVFSVAVQANLDLSLFRNADPGVSTVTRAVCALQVYEPYEAPFGAGEAEQWELGEPHDLPALLSSVHDSIPAAVPHRECSQPNRILKYDLNKLHKFKQLGQNLMWIFFPLFSQL